MLNRIDAEDNNTESERFDILSSKLINISSVALAKLYGAEKNCQLDKFGSNNYLGQTIIWVK